MTIMTDISSVSSATATIELAEEDKWLQSCDLDGFKKEVDLLGRELAKNQGPEDMQHLNKMLMWNRCLNIVGLATLGSFPNPITVTCLSLATFSNWTMIGHHVCHGGYDKVDKSGRYHRSRFALGSLYRRAMDWFDWILTSAWISEHNKGHHMSLNQEEDPDLVEANLEILRNSSMPLAFKYVAVVFYMLTWKWLYYAPNTFSHLQLDQARQEGKEFKMPSDERNYVTVISAFNPPPWLSVFDLFMKVLLPYFLWRFVLTPLPLLFLFGEESFKYGIFNLVLAELLTNVHAFIAVVTNHAGNDLYRFEKSCQPRSAQYYVRQVVGSVNFSCGNDFIDFLHGFLNYQIEHHLWPSLSMLSYQRSQPKVKALCEKYGIPYRQENVFRRLKKTVDIMIGTANMRIFPAQYENQEGQVENEDPVESVVHQ
jgi:fatty acid desaturase